ncbi:MAG: tetratricopeptide repeat protein [Candidatus Cloacimonadota bacterium]|nr:tetratricopeptide repeat protein [Candidatus Cloacimonadota bacterium]
MKKIYIVIFGLFLFSSLFANLADDFRFAKKMYDDTLYEEAINKFTELIDEYPTSEQAEEAYLFIGNSYSELEKFPQAIDAYTHFIKAYPDSKLLPNATYRLAESDFQYKLYKAAATNYQFLVDNYPRSPFTLQSLKKLVLAYKNSDQLNQAILTSQDILRNYPKNSQIPAILLILANVYQENQMQEKYVLALEKIIFDYEESDARWLAAKNLVNYYYQKGDMQKAREIVKNNLTDFTPREYEKTLVLIYADILNDSGEYDLAKAEFQTYFRKFNDAENLDFVAYQIATLNFKLGDFDETITNCIDFQKEFPQSKFMSKIHLLVSKAYMQKKNYTLALRQLKESNFKNSSEKLQYLAQSQRIDILQKQNLYEKVIPQYLDLIQHYPKFVSVDSVYFHIAFIYQGTVRNYKKALNYYQMLLTAYPQSKLFQNVHLQMAECYEKIGQYKEALDILQTLQSMGRVSVGKSKQIEEQIVYLTKFRIKEQNVALDNLMKSFLGYISSGSKKEAIVSIVEIYRKDLKQFQRAIQVLEKNSQFDSDPSFLLLKGETYLDLAGKFAYENNSDFNQYYSQAKFVFNTIIDKFGDENIFEKEFAEFYMISLNGMQYEKGSREYVEFVKHSSLKFVEKYNTFSQIGTVYFNLAKALLQSPQISAEEQKNIIIYLQQSATLTNNKIIRNEAYSLLGNIYLQNESYSAALNQYKKISDLYKNRNGNLLFNIGFAEKELRHWQKSLQSLKQFVTDFKQNKNYWKGIELLGDIYLQTQNYEEAIYYYKILVSQNPSDEIYRKLRSLYTSEKLYSDAVDISNKIKEKTNSDRRNLANIYLEMGAKANAILILKKCIETDSTSKELLIDLEKLASINFEIGDFLTAKDNYEQLIYLTRDYEDRTKIKYLNWNQIAGNGVIANYRIKSRTGAENYQAIFETTIKNNSEVSSNILLEKGIYYSELNQEKANEVFDEIIKKYPSAGFGDDAYFQMALMALSQKNYELAQKKLSDLIKKYPNSELVNNAYLKLGSMDFAAGNYNKALEYYKVVIENDAEGTLAKQAIENFALTCKTMGEWMVAIEAYQLLLDRLGSPDLKPQTLFEIAYCYFMDKNYEKAIELFQNIIVKVNDPALKVESYYWIGESYYGLQKYDKTIETLLKIVYDYSSYSQWFVNASIKIAMAYEQEEKYQKAKMFYENVINRFGTNNRWGKEAKKLLDQLPTN